MFIVYLLQDHDIAVLSDLFPANLLLYSNDDILLFDTLYLELYLFSSLSRKLFSLEILCTLSHMSLLNKFPYGRAIK